VKVVLVLVVVLVLERRFVAQRVECTNVLPINSDLW